MKSILPKLCCTLLLITLLRCCSVKAQVSSKLDFDDVENDNRTSSADVPVLQGRADGQNTGGGASGGSVGSGKAGGNDGKSRPKIHGVRVTVDTGDADKPKESKESVEITDVGKHKKRVGIHTDITFEISANGDDDSNGTSSAQRSDSDKEDASVPIYKGRGGAGNTHKPRSKPHDPKTHWTPSYSAEGRSYDGSWRSGSPGYAGYYPHYPHNVPVYTGSGDSRGGSGNVYRQGDGWTSYVPVTGRWTTERPTRYDPYRPNSVTGYRAPEWKPCYCLTDSGADNRRRRESVHGSELLQAASPVMQVIDAKLENPFSRK